MDCREAQQLLLAAENPAAMLAENAAIAAHVRDCPDCRRLLARLQRLADAAAHLPPGPPTAPSAAFLAQIAALDAPPPAPLAKITPAPSTAPRPWRSRAVAAAIILVVGLTALTLCLHGNAARADSLLSDLASWNLQLAQSGDLAQRTALYQQRAGEMKQRVANASLSPEDRAVAQAMLDTAAQQAAGESPLDNAARFSQLAEQVRTLESGAATPERRATLEHLRQDLAQGVKAHLQTVNPGTLAPADQERFRTLQQQVNPQPQPIKPGPGASLPFPRPPAQNPAPAMARLPSLMPADSASALIKTATPVPHTSAAVPSADAHLPPPAAPLPRHAPDIDTAPPTASGGHAGSITTAPLPHDPATAAINTTSSTSDPDAIPPTLTQGSTAAKPVVDEAAETIPDAPRKYASNGSAIARRQPPPAPPTPPITKPTAQPLPPDLDGFDPPDMRAVTDAADGPHASARGRDAKGLLETTDAHEFWNVRGGDSHAAAAFDAGDLATTLKADLEADFAADLQGGSVPLPPHDGPSRDGPAASNPMNAHKSLPWHDAKIPLMNDSLTSASAGLTSAAGPTSAAAPAASAAPEPATAIMLLLAILLLLRRRRSSSTRRHV